VFFYKHPTALPSFSSKPLWAENVAEKPYFPHSPNLSSPIAPREPKTLFTLLIRLRFVLFIHATKVWKKKNKVIKLHRLVFPTRRVGMFIETNDV
jgi:hypothetical protein